MENSDILQKYLQTRLQTEKICETLATEDYVVQAAEEVSPAKWHIAHVSWFFENFLLIPHHDNYQVFNKDFALLFNSYYKTQGSHWKQGKRGQLSRPLVSEVFDYRRYVDENMKNFLNTKKINQKDIHLLLEIGIHHEQQHQELLLMDMKYNLSANPGFPPYFKSKIDPKFTSPKGSEFSQFKEGLYEIGVKESSSFHFDNESPRHKVYLKSFAINQNFITNSQYLSFMEEGAYEKPNLWKSDGWDYIQESKDKKPLYWWKDSGQWFEYNLDGLSELNPNAPVKHINFYEADAFARWSGMRLPTEAEWEVYSENFPQTKRAFYPDFHESSSAMDSSTPHGILWQWTSSDYSAYPAYKQDAGALGEYNGKFMCNQKVLRGGCFATPRSHYRNTYRNFFRPEQKWAFTGIRLAKDLS